jgi:hypothetical protein
VTVPVRSRWAGAGVVLLDGADLLVGERDIERELPSDAYCIGTPSLMFFSRVVASLSD